MQGRVKKIRHAKNTKKFNTLSATELKNLVQGAQSFDQHAIDRLCAIFKPLIIAATHKSYIIGTLGGDAENTAWEIFLEFIHQYKGNKFSLLPGLIKTHIEYELLHKLYPRKPVSVEDEVILDATDGNGQRLYEPSDNNASMDKFFEERFFKDVYAYLTPRQRDVIDAICKYRMSVVEYSKDQGIAYSSAFLLLRRSLKAVRSIINN